MKHFSGGVHPQGFKELSKGAAITEMTAPKTLYFPLSQHIGAPAEAIVKTGDRVKIGTLIGKAAGYVSANVFSSVSGTVKGVETLALASGIKAAHIVIENDFKDDTVRMPKLNNPSPLEITDRIRACGVVGMGGAGFPTDVKLTPPKGKAVDTLVINAAECEPYITCDYRVMIEYTEQVIKGIVYLMTALSVKRTVIGIEDNKSDAADRLHLAIKNLHAEGIEVAVLPTRYPQGAEKQLIYAVLGRVVPQGGLPAEVGVAVQNVQTAFSAYLAVWDGLPLCRRVVTVTGHGCKKPMNLWVRNGTLMRDIIALTGVSVSDAEMEEARLAAEPPVLQDATKEGEQANTSRKQPRMTKERKAAIRRYEQLKRHAVTKIISGGPMMGLALGSDMVASTKTTSCVLLLTAADNEQPPISQCINCGRCGRACPMKLMPMYIDSYALAKDWDGAKKYGALDCIQCGCCSYVCPAKRPLVQSIAYARKVMKEKGIK